MRLVVRISKLQILLAAIIVYIHVDCLASPRASWLKVSALALLDCALIFTLFGGRRKQAAAGDARTGTVVVGTGRTVVVRPPVRVDELARALDLRPFKLVDELMELNVFARVDGVVDMESATTIAQRHGWIVIRAQEQS